jgi:FtsH-binding integral membrane protein
MVSEDAQSLPIQQNIRAGFSVCMFGMTGWVLLFQRRDRKINAPMLIAAVMLWIFATCVGHFLISVLCPQRDLLF